MADPNDVRRIFDRVVTLVDGEEPTTTIKALTMVLGHVIVSQFSPTSWHVGRRLVNEILTDHINLVSNKPTKEKAS